MKKLFIIPNLITSFGLACGLFVIFKVNMTAGFDYTLIHTMTFILLLASFADVLDGAIARVIRGESEFGLAFDSLSDAISFGVAPSVLFLSSISLSSGTFEEFFALSASMIYTICGVLRLVRYNIKQGIDKEEKSKAFIGLPIPAAAMAFVSPNLLFFSPFFLKSNSITMESRIYILCSIGIILAYLMLSKIRFSSIKSFNYRLRSFQTVFFGSLMAIFFLYGLIHNLALLLIAMSWGYIFVSLISSIFNMNKKKR